MTLFVYLHGFASGPDSFKATAFRREFAARGLGLLTPELDGGDFENLTITGQIEVVRKLLAPHGGRQPVALIGSSLGGYLACLLAQIRAEVAALYLMAPALEFLDRWRQRLGVADGEALPPMLRVFHYRYNEEKPLNAKLFADAREWERIVFDRQLPTRIVHGARDATVPVELSRSFARAGAWREFQELDSDHGLGSHTGWIVQDCLSSLERWGLLPP